MVFFTGNIIIFPSTRPYRYHAFTAFVVHRRHLLTFSILYFFLSFFRWFFCVRLAIENHHGVPIPIIEKKEKKGEPLRTDIIINFTEICFTCISVIGFEWGSSTIKKKKKHRHNTESENREGCYIWVWFLTR